MGKLNGLNGAFQCTRKPSILSSFITSYLTSSFLQKSSLQHQQMPCSKAKSAPIHLSEYTPHRLHLGNEVSHGGGQRVARQGATFFIGDSSPLRRGMKRVTVGNIFLKIQFYTKKRVIIVWQRLNTIQKKKNVKKLDFGIEKCYLCTIWPTERASQPLPKANPCLWQRAAAPSIPEKK